MHTVRIVGIRPNCGPIGADDAELAHDAIWAHAGPDRGVEHITVTSAVDFVEIVFFIRHDIANPLGYVEELLRRAIARSPVLARWRVYTTLLA